MGMKRVERYASAEVLRRSSPIRGAARVCGQPQVQTSRLHRKRSQSMTEAHAIVQDLDEFQDFKFDDYRIQTSFAPTMCMNPLTMSFERVHKEYTVLAVST
jgi:hypothetical protein